MVLGERLDESSPGLEVVMHASSEHMIAKLVLIVVNCKEKR